MNQLPSETSDRAAGERAKSEIASGPSQPPPASTAENAVAQEPPITTPISTRAPEVLDLSASPEVVRSARWWPRLLAEFMVVFLGVYGAFFLDGCRESQRDELRRNQIVDTLREDFREGRESVRALSGWFEGSLGAPVLDRLTEGEQPRLLPIPLPTTMESSSWNAVLAAGGMDVLDTRLIRDVERSIGATATLGSVARQYNDYVRTVLVPNLDLGTEEFYNSDGTALKPKYLWYYFSLQSYRDTLKQVEGQFEQVVQSVDDAP